jgi:hypothetical protein
MLKVPLFSHVHDQAVQRAAGGEVFDSLLALVLTSRNQDHLWFLAPIFLRNSDDRFRLHLMQAGIWLLLILQHRKPFSKLLFTLLLSEGGIFPPVRLVGNKHHSRALHDQYMCKPATPKL